MHESSPRVGFLHEGSVSEEQHAAFEWLCEGFDAERVAFDDLTAADWDVLWWHRDAPIPDGGPLAAAAPEIERFLAAGGGLVLTLRGMASVDALDVETVPPDEVGVHSVTEPTGVLWRSLYADHPAVAEFDRLRLPVCDRGAVPVARYETVLPWLGEVLASTVRDGQDIPHEMTAVSWDANPGTVLDIGAPLAFHELVSKDVTATRDALATGCLRAAADEMTGTVARRRRASSARCARLHVAGQVSTPNGRPSLMGSDCYDDK